MNKRNYYILTEGKLQRHENTVFFYSKDGNRTIIPVEKVYAIYIFAPVSLTSGVISYLSAHGVPVHFFSTHENYRGTVWPAENMEFITGARDDSVREEYEWLDEYEASLYPREKLLSGTLLVEQVRHYIDHDRRMYIARRFVEGAARNILLNLKYYDRNSGNLGDEISRIEKEMGFIDSTETIPELMHIEGQIREIYYGAFDSILPDRFRFEKRTRRPPENMVNAMISFGNSLMYSTVLSEIYNTQLNPTISYLHEPFQRRFSLALDISEIFKPVVVDRVIFKLLNKSIITEGDFRKDFNYYLLNSTGKRKFLTEYENKLKTTLQHRNLKRKVSFQRLIRLECYKLIQHLIGGKRYRPFVMWW